MLRCRQTRHFAPEHSPFREQRLLFAVTPDPVQPESNEDTGKASQAESSHNTGDVSLSKRQEFHDALFGALWPDDQRRVLEQFRPEIERRIGHASENISDPDLGALIELTRESVANEINRAEADRMALSGIFGRVDTSTADEQELRRLIAENWFAISEYLTLGKNYNPFHVVDLLQARLHKDIEHLRMSQIRHEPGVKQDNLTQTQFENTYRKAKNISQDEAVDLPRAFSYGDTIHYNVDHPDFHDPVHGKLNRQRCVTHEHTHQSLKMTGDEKFAEKLSGHLRSHPMWNELKQAMLELYRNDVERVEADTTGRMHDRMIREALAIYFENRRYPIPADERSPQQQAQAKITEIVERMFANPHTGELPKMHATLESTLDRLLETEKRGGKTGSSSKAIDRMSRAVAERAAHMSVDKKMQKNLDSFGVENDPGEGLNLVNGELADAKKDSEKLSVEEVMTKARSLSEKIHRTSGQYEDNIAALKAIVEAESEDGKSEEVLAILDANREFFSEASNDLAYMQARISTADSLPAEERDGLLGIAKETIDGYGKTLEKIDALLIEKNNIQQSAASGETSVWQWFRTNVFSSNGQVMWMTPLNILNTIKIYKDAIVQNYNSNQKVKENKFAKGINFYRPIQHTLNKLARSTNSQETSEFLEYIEKEGFTFDKVFGDDGRGNKNGLLYENRHNFNRFKAVLEYAANHAWLYHLDPFDGHKVYGVDYEGIEGHQSFEDLVQKYEAGKTHEINHGYEKVDKYPDVPPIIEFMMHELELKNIYAVQGIMKRLQEKAKYSHSNTWMLTTLVMMMRDHPELQVCFDKGMIDNISNFTISQSAWSVTWLKVLRNDLMKWKDGNGAVEFENNILTKTLRKIEDRLKREGVEFDGTHKGMKAKYEAIGIIMAGKTYRTGTFAGSFHIQGKYAPAQPISIYEDEFNDYRTEFMDTANTTTEPKKTDDDYFNPGNGGSDILLAGRKITEAMISRESQGKFVNGTQADGYFGQLFDRYNDLLNVGGNAQDNFRKDMIQKLVPNIRSNFIQNQNGRDQFKKDLVTPQSKKTVSLLWNLIDMGVVTEETLGTPDWNKLWVSDDEGKSEAKRRSASPKPLIDIGTKEHLTVTPTRTQGAAGQNAGAAAPTLGA